jgi:hypothetical protein
MKQLELFQRKNEVLDKKFGALGRYVFGVRFKAIVKQGTTGMAKPNEFGQVEDIDTYSNPIEIREQMEKEVTYQHQIVPLETHTSQFG